MTSNSEVETGAIDSQATETITTQTENIITASIATQTHCISPVTNTVLGYMQYGLDSGSADRLHTLALATFSAEEIIAARQVLYDECLLGKPQPKHNSSARTRSAAMVTDIIEKMQQYENSLPDLFLRPSGLARLKKFGVEDLSEVAMADQIRKLQIQMARVHDDLQYHTEDIIEIRGKFNKHLSGHSTNASPSSDVLTTLVQSLSSASTVSSKVSPKRHPGIHSNSASLKPFVSGGLFSTSFPPPSLTPSGVKFGVLSKEPSPAPIVDPDPKQPSAPPIDALTPKQRHASQANGLSPKQPTAPPLEGSSLTSPGLLDPQVLHENFPPLSISNGAVSKNVPNPQESLVSDAGSQNRDQQDNSGTSASLLSKSNLDGDKGKWSVHTNNRKKLFSAQQARLVQGKSTNCKIKSAAPRPPPLYEVCLRGVDPDVCIETMVCYLKENDIEVIDISYMFQRKHSSAFVIRVPSSYYDRLFNPELWGPGITVTKYFKPKD